jgi:hypothetical protein
MRFISALSVLCATYAKAEDYQRFADTMYNLGYDWEPIEVHTEDGYILTTFHVTGWTGYDPYVPTMPPVLINHGDYSDGAGWLSDDSWYGTPIHL